MVRAITSLAGELERLSLIRVPILSIPLSNQRWEMSHIYNTYYKIKYELQEEDQCRLQEREAPLKGREPINNTTLNAPMPNPSPRAPEYPNY